ncbi:MAG: hypothetical protein LBV00_03160 [Propionibacteriaceae bacterium]|jgi:hypothetical protein|nr:hypothetical protein [Propionibacteriaceae bacterium]
MTTNSGRHRYVPGESVVLDETTVDLASLDLHDSAGAPLTEECFERLADQAKSQQRRGLTPGGKSLNGDGSHSPVLRLVVSNEMRDKVAQAASVQRMSVSRWLPGAVEEKLAA